MEPCRSECPERVPGTEEKAVLVNKIRTRFGEVEYDDANILHFHRGPIGFENLREFVVMPNLMDGPLFWIQSVEDPEVAFLLTDPTQFFLDYRIAPDSGECARLGIDEKDHCFVLSVVTVHRDRSVSLNLAAPVLFAPKTNRAMQVVLENSPFKSRTPLPKVD